MKAPDRSVEVKAICAQHPEAFGPPDDTNDARRLALLMSVIIPALNRVDNGKWGILRKNDQRGKVPCDVIVWRDTEEHFDVMTGTGATWIAHGKVTNPAWLWEAVLVPVPTDPAPAPPTPWPSSPSEPDIAHVLDRLAALERAVDRLTDTLPSVLEDITALETRRYVATLWGGIRIVSVPE